LRIEFADVEGFLGIRGVSTSVVTAGGGAASGYAFKQGERYLVYATKERGGTGLVTGTCSRTRLLADAREDLQFLETLSASGTPRAHVFGTITHWERDLATEQPIDYGPVRDVLITVHTVGGAVDAWTDARGRYDVSVAPGSYEVTARPPAGFSQHGLRQTIELRDARACFAADFGVRFDGGIRGSVRRSSGGPAERATVEIMAAEAARKTGNIETLRAVADASGNTNSTKCHQGATSSGLISCAEWTPKSYFQRRFIPARRQRNWRQSFASMAASSANSNRSYYLRPDLRTD
jgi:hypothetical protein